MKRFLITTLTMALVVVACLLILPTTAEAASESDLTFTLNDDGESYCVSDCVWNASGELAIPSTYNDKPVTSIGESAFSSCGISSITIPDSVTSIGNFAFYDCTGLEEINFNAVAMNDFAERNYVFYCAGQNSNGITVNIGANVTKIPAYLFCPYYDSSKYSPKITKVNFAEGSVCESIGKYAFSDCNSLTSITIPDSVTSIGKYAFWDCTSLTSVTIGNSVTSIGGYAFAYCTSLTSAAIGNGVTSIGYGAFYSCKSLTSVTIPDSVTSIGESAFSSCGISSITIPDSVTSIGDCAFYKCTGLEEINFNAVAMNDLAYDNDVFSYAGKNGNGITVNIGANVTKIPAYLFNPDYSSDYSPKITKVNFAEGSICESIGECAFCNCTRLTGITIPDSVTSIGEDAFYGCSSLTSITIPDGVTSIGDRAFNYCSSLTSITIPDNVTSIGDFAFSSCTSLTSVIIPDSVTSIGYCAFNYCSSLTSVTIPDSVTSIGKYAFEVCTALEEINFNAVAMNDLDEYSCVFAYAGQNSNGITVNIGANVTKIPAYLFCPNYSTDYSPKITKVNFAEGCVCESIGDYAFAYCSGLTSVTIPDSVTSIGDDAFYNCTGLEEINFNAVAMNGLGEYNSAFDNAGKNGNGITVNIGANVTTIPAYLFYSSSSYSYDYSPKVTKVNFAEGSICESIGAYAFYDCDSLTSITIPDSVTSIGNYAFDYCTSLTSLTIPDSVTSIGSYAFEDCTSLTRVTIGNGVTSIGDRAFYDCTGLVSVIYCGTHEQWNAINIGLNNTSLTAAELQFHSVEYGVCAICGYRPLYIIAFKDWDGTDISTRTYYWGDTVTIPPNPIRVPNNTYTYTFAGWDKDVVDCTGDATYTATYTSNYIDYTVVFKNWNGDVLSTDTYHYGDQVVAPEIPTKAADNTYTYTFAGWDKDVVDCTGDATYTATYTSNYIDYTVVFKNWNGKVLSTNSYHYGDQVILPGAPVREDDETYTYIFAGWDQEVLDCQGDAVYTATYTKAVKLQIIKQPVSVAVTEGKAVNISVGVTGDGLTYKWYYKEKGQSAFTYTATFKGNSYDTTMTSARNGRQVYCVVTDKYGNSAVSNTATMSMANPAKITSQPGSVTATNGATVNITLRATGDGLTYKWYYKNKGASAFTLTTTFTGNSYDTTMTAARNGRQVYCVVTDKYGNSVKSNTATMTMKNPLKITKQPASVSVANNKALSIKVSATGDGLRYQWYYKNKGQSAFKLTTTFTGNSYDTTMTAARNGRQVYCVVTDKYGNSVKSNTATMTMKNPLKITKQPASVSVANNKALSIKVSATGDGLRYQWYYKDKGQSAFKLTTTFTGNSYDTTMTAARNGRQVCCVVTDKYGNSVMSGVATMTMASKVTITKQPTSVSVANGKTATVSFTASGDGLTYKWYYKDKGASEFCLTTTFTGNTYTAQMNADRNGRQLFCMVIDKYGNVVTTNIVTIGMQNKAKITKQPASVSVANGKTATVSFTASGEGMTYKWYFKNKGESTFKLTTTFTGNAYTAQMNAARNGRKVYCVVTDKYGNSVKTNIVTISMK